ncbi:MAG: hypothetical protein OEV94_00695 [Deltaproteobacteria bacterium]|nr:hypothetical protein [Deltaproteobacteria bacterium]
MSKPRPPLDPQLSALELSEIVGEEAQAGHRMQAGPILALVDLVAARVAAHHANTFVATLMFDRVDLSRPIQHMDLIRLGGRLVRVGQSSMMVEVLGRRTDMMAREEIPILRSFVTIVAVDEAGQPDKTIPGLTAATEEDRALQAEVAKRRKLADEWFAMQESNASGALTPAGVVEDANRTKREYITPLDSEIKVVRQFLPRHLNYRGTIFGGDLLLWMDRVAVYAACHFTRNRHMVTIAMNRLLFKKPIFASDLVSMTARVVYVRTYTLEVEIKVRLRHADGSEEDSHSGFFTVLNYDESGFKRPISTGLRLREEDQEGLAAYHKAKLRHQFWETQEFSP